jgi:hypothetical protein
MAEFQNTIDLLGDEAVTKALVEKTITELRDDVIKTVANNRLQFCKSLVRIDLPNLTTILDVAFQNCTSLAYVNAPKVTMIDKSAFAFCSKLASVDFPKVTSVGVGVFEYCSSLTSAKLPLLTNLAGAFKGCTALTEVYVPSATEATSSSFNGCTSLSFVDLPSMKKIANQVFYGCVSLKTIVLRSETLCTLSNTNSFSGVTATNELTPFASGKAGGTLLVPRALTTEYPNATNWSVVIAWNENNRVLTLEDYTVDGTITGEIDWDKLNGGN